MPASSGSLTLDDANALLAAQDVTPRFSAGLLRDALRAHRPARIRRAISLVHTNAGAKRFLMDLLTADSPGGGAARDPRDERRPTAVSDDSSANGQRRHAADAAGGGRFDSRGAERGRPLPLTFKAYGRQAAIELREHTAPKGYATVMLEAAGALGGRRYDWAKKISLQLMPRELPVVAAVLVGALPECEFRHHGTGRNKGFSIERQDRAGSEFFFKVFRSGDNSAMHAVPVPAEEAFYFAALLLRQLARMVPGASSEVITAALRGYASVARKAASRE